MASTITPQSAALSSARPVHTGRVLAIILTGLMMAMIDISIVNVALPTIRSTLHASGSGLQLVTASYTIVYAVLLVTGARLGDIFGHGRIFRIGLAVFTLSSLACGLAGNTGQLVVFRCLQGLGSAMMLPQVLSTIQRTFPGPSRAGAMRKYSAVIASGSVVGQVLGGALVSADLFGSSWRPVFLVNVPIGLVLLVLSAKYLPADKGEPGRKLDLPGLLTLSPAVLALVVPLVLGHEQHWPLWGWIMLGGSVLLFALFVTVEGRATSPIIPSRVLRLPGMLATIAAMFLAMSVFSGGFFVTSMHLQGALHFSALRAGLTFIPTAVLFALISLNWGRVPARYQRWLSLGGFVLSAVSSVGQALVYSGGGTHGLWLYVVLGLSGLGTGAAFSPLMTLALMRVPVADAADTSGVLGTVMQLAITVGVATFGTLFLTLAVQAGAHPSAHALVVTQLALGAASLGGAIMAGTLLKHRVG